MTRLLTPDQIIELANVLAPSRDEVKVFADKIKDWADTTYNQAAAVDALSFETADYAKVTKGMTIDEAVLYCNFLSIGGHTDWRLPYHAEIAQLHEIFDNGTDDDEYVDINFWLQEDIGGVGANGGISYILPVRTK